MGNEIIKKYLLDRGWHQVNYTPDNPPRGTIPKGVAYATRLGAVWKVFEDGENYDTDLKMLSDTVDEILTATQVKVLPTKRGSVILILSRNGITTCTFAMLTEDLRGPLQWVTSMGDIIDPKFIGDDWLPATINVEGVASWELELMTEFMEEG